jgi:hypothetical protein
VLNTPYLPYNKNNIQAPEGNLGRNSTSAAKSLGGAPRVMPPGACPLGLHVVTASARG